MKKLFSIAVASAMVLSMAGCGSANKQSAPASSGASGSQAASGAASSTPAEAPKASGADVFKIGGMGPLTGDASAYGLGVKNAAQIAVDEVNAAGGVTVNGKSYQLELNFQDDVCDAANAVTAYNTVKDWGAQMILGAVTSGASIAVSAETSKDNMFQITPSGSAVDCTKTENAFRVCFSDPNQGAASAQYISENKLAKKVAIIYDSSDVYSSGIYESFVKGAKNQTEFEIVAQEAFTADSKTNFSAQLQAAKDKGADLVFLPFYYNEAALVLAQAKQMNFAPKFFGCDGMDGILGVKNFDTSLAEGLMLLTPFAADATDDLTQKFVKAYKDKHGDIPNQFAADAYDGVYAIKAAIEKGGITPDMSVSDICEAMKKAMVSITVDGLTGSGMTWEASGEPNKAPKAVVIKNGAYASM